MSNAQDGPIDLNADELACAAWIARFLKARGVDRVFGLQGGHIQPIWDWLHRLGVRIVDVRLLAGNTAVHSDMLMWSNHEPVASAALQLLNILFSVPQISVRIDTIPADHRQMLAFWLGFWREHREVLLDGDFQPLHPEQFYPFVLARGAARWIGARLEAGSDALAGAQAALSGPLGASRWRARVTA